MTLESTIAVAVLTYNRSKTAIRSIESIIASPKVDSIYIFDDGSSDRDIENLEFLCNKYTNLKLIKNKKNIGYAENLIQALEYLAKLDNEFLFICESDMLLTDKWGECAIDILQHSPDSVALSPMLHRDQIKKNSSRYYQNVYMYGEFYNDSLGKKIYTKKPFGSTYKVLPNQLKPKKIGNYKVFYSSNSIGTILFKKAFLKILIKNINEIRNYPKYEDGWLSWACFAFNNFSPKSIISPDPGMAFTFGGKGLHGYAILTNARWNGSFWWRYEITAYFSRIFYQVVLLPFRAYRRLLK